MCRPMAPWARKGSVPFQILISDHYPSCGGIPAEIMSEQSLPAGLSKPLDIPRIGFGGPGAGGQLGFTLTELVMLIGVFTLMAVTAVPAYSYFLGGKDEHQPLISRPIALQANAEVQAAELMMVQMAMDAMMASNQLSRVDPSSKAGTDIFDTLPSGAGTEPLYPGFLRTKAGFTDCVYMWTKMGQVYQFTCP